MTSAHMTAYKSGKHHSAKTGDQYMVYFLATLAVFEFMFYFLQHFYLTLLGVLYKCHSLICFVKYFM